MVKIRWTDRLLMALCGVIGVMVSIGLGALILYRRTFSISIAGYILALQDSWITIVILAVLAVVLLFWSVRMLMLAFWKPPKMDKSSVSVQNTENGSVRVSVQAMDMLVKRAVEGTEGVVDVKTRIDNHDDSITVNVDMTLESDVHIPNVTMLMQRNIKNFIEEYSGIAVREVRVMVSKIVEVTPQPPLQIEAPDDHGPEVIDQPDAIIASSEESEPVAEPITQDEIEDQPPVEEFEADHQPPDPGTVQDPAPENEGKDADTITEKDFW